MNTVSKYYNYLFLVLILFLVLNNSYQAQSSWQTNNYKSIKFEHLSIEHGLSQIAVQSILQDSKGFLWFGTEDGLNRYDGYKFTIYRYIEDDTTSISDNFIWSIAEDNSGNIWIGTNGGGLNRYDYNTNTFKRFTHNPSNSLTISENNIRKVFVDSQNNIWVGTNSAGICRYNKGDNTFTRFQYKESDNSISSNNIRSITEDSNNNLFIATEGGGLNKFNQSTKTFTALTSFRIDDLEINIPIVWSVLSKGSNIWIGTYEKGLINYNIKTGLSKLYKTNQAENSLINNNITNLLIDNSGHLWICTEAGISILDTLNSKFINYQHNLSDINSLSNNIVRSVYEDKSNLIWLGTIGGGINKINLNKKFEIYTHNPSDENSVSHNMIRAIYEDSDANLWIGTLGNGLNLFDKHRNKFEHFSMESQGKNISNNIITSIWQDEEKYIWIGTWGGGINRIKFESNKYGNHSIKTIKYFVNNPDDPTSISSNIVQAIFEDSEKNLWIGTEFGLNKFERGKNKFTSFNFSLADNNTLSDDRIQSKCIIEDKAGNLWVGTWRGLNRFKKSGNSSNQSNYNIQRFLHDPQNQNSIGNNRVVSLYEDEIRSNKDTTIIWIGTVGAGLNKLTIINSDSIQDTNYQYLHYTENNGLPNNAVYGILEDEAGNIWLSTNNGIARFNPLRETFRTYDISDGLQSNQFFWGAFHKCSDGEMFFGGINGLNSFNPNLLEENTYVPPVYITNCSIVSADNEKYNLNSFTINENISLAYNSYTISFEFAALDFTTPEKNQYEYILEGHDEQWNLLTGKNNVTYSNISDGEYVFKVKGSNNDRVWNEEGVSLQFRIMTPFWKTTYFVAAILILIVSMVIYFVTTQIKNILAVERLRTKIAADLHDNIGSSLTEISILSEVISSKIKPENQDVLSILTHISERSRSLVDEMSDIVWLVNPKRDSLYDLILRLEDTYSEILSHKGISFRSADLKVLEKISLSMEHRQNLFLIFKEGINNSITHSDCSEIQLNATVKGKYLFMELRDNGAGFDLNDKSDNLGNGLNNMINRAKKIGGKLKIESGNNSGTKLSFKGHIA